MGAGTTLAVLRLAPGCRRYHSPRLRSQFHAAAPLTIQAASWAGLRLPNRQPPVLGVVRLSSLSPRAGQANVRPLAFATKNLPPARSAGLRHPVKNQRPRQLMRWRFCIAVFTNADTSLSPTGTLLQISSPKSMTSRLAFMVKLMYLDWGLSNKFRLKLRLAKL